MIRACFAAAAMFSVCGFGIAQVPQPAIAQLNAAKYPPIALAARVEGEVVLRVQLGPDAMAADVTVESGPPMLREAAIESAKQSLYHADGESSQGGFRLIYRFVLKVPEQCGDGQDKTYPRVQHDGNIVTITAQSAAPCDYGVVEATIHVRSAKCLYLWRCGTKGP
ncbi:MAG: energy transducer TonB [Acidobacteriota bacterium]|nr:energy transducer TonB [Acidobacteriota bacterium]